MNTTPLIVIDAQQECFMTQMCVDTTARLNGFLAEVKRSTEL